MIKSTIRNYKEVFKQLVFKDINYRLSGKQNLTDIDGVFEIKGHVFIIESKTHKNGMNDGQLCSLLNQAFNTYMSGKNAQLVYRIGTEDGKLTYLVWGTKQFEDMLNGCEPFPHILKNKTNDWLAKRLQKFEALSMSCDNKETNQRNRHIFGMTDKLKNII